MFTAINLEPFFNDLTEKHWAVLPTDRYLCEKLLQCALEHRQTGRFKTAQITAPVTHQSEAIRNDQTYWLEPTDNKLDGIELSTLKSLNQLTEDIKNYFRLPLKELECHYSIYEPGHYYRRHTDVTLKENRRLFSFVVYLNPEWQLGDGGQLVGYSGSDRIFSIVPRAGQMVIFKSEIEHEVLKTNRTRYALTGWMRR